MCNNILVISEWPDEGLLIVSECKHISMWFVREMLSLDSCISVVLILFCCFVVCQRCIKSCLAMVVTLPCISVLLGLNNLAVSFSFSVIGILIKRCSYILCSMGFESSYLYHNCQVDKLLLSPTVWITPYKLTSRMFKSFY